MRICRDDNQHSTINTILTERTSVERQGDERLTAIVDKNSLYNHRLSRCVCVCVAEWHFAFCQQSNDDELQFQTKLLICRLRWAISDCLRELLRTVRHDSNVTANRIYVSGERDATRNNSKWLMVYGGAWNCLKNLCHEQKHRKWENDGGRRSE